MAAAGSKMPAASDRHCMRVRVPDQSGDVRGQKVNFAGSRRVCDSCYATGGWCGMATKLQERPMQSILVTCYKINKGGMLQPQNTTAELMIWRWDHQSNAQNFKRKMPPRDC